MNWANERGVADEAHIDKFVAEMGGERVDQRFPNARFPNADYIFAKDKILIELKVLETEFGDTEALQQRELALMEEVARKFGAGPIIRGEPEVQRHWAKAKFNHYRIPLCRIVDKANRQLRATKAALGDDGYRGLLWLVTDAGRRRLGGRALRREERHAPAVARPPARPTNAEGRGRRPRQQDRANGLGDHDFG